MPLSVPTLYLASTLSALVIACVLALIWWQNPQMRSLRWWSATYLLAACGIVLLIFRGAASPWVTIGLSNGFIILAHGMLWVGACVFAGRTARPLWPIVSVGAWLLMSFDEEFLSSVPLRTITGTVLVSLWTGLAAWELTHARRKGLPSLLPMIVLCCTHAAVMTVTGIGAVAIGNSTPDPVLAPTLWFAVRSVEGYFFSIASGIALVALVKEQAERMHHARAVTDPLTGVFNRRELFDKGEFLLRDTRSAPHSVSAILFDLDNFKSVNDRDGHPAGDDLLILFARTAAAQLHHTDVLGRIGGDEFAVFLRGTAREATRVAEQVLEEFRTRCADSLIGSGGAATVSAGIASRRGDEELEKLMGRADRALYVAKKRGRNRVESITI